MKESKIIIIMVIAVVAGLVGGVVMFATGSQPAGTGDLREAAQGRMSEQAGQTPETPEKAEPQKKVSYQGEEGRSALELLKQKHEVETDTFDGIGEFVVSIDGVVADDKHFWAVYVNDQLSQVGASEYITKLDDTITWKLEAIQ